MRGGNEDLATDIEANTNFLVNKRKSRMRKRVESKDKMLFHTIQEGGSIKGGILVDGVS